MLLVLQVPLNCCIGRVPSCFALQIEYVDVADPLQMLLNPSERLHHALLSKWDLLSLVIVL